LAYLILLSQYTAASCDRGRVLRSLVMALEEHLEFAVSKSIETGLKFPVMIVELVSSRPTVFADAMESFPDLRSLVIHAVHSEFVRHAKAGAKDKEAKVKDAVILKPRNTISGEKSAIHLPLSVLLSISVVLSTWRDSMDDRESAIAVDSLVDALMRNDTKDNEDDCGDAGLASAVIADSNLVAVSLESVSALLI